MKNSSIQWTDHTFNPWEGCTKVAPECKNCYAETLVDHRFSRAKWGKGQPRRRTSETTWRQPLAWDKWNLLTCPSCKIEFGTRFRVGAKLPGHCGQCGQPAVPRRARVFCLSLGDWLDEEVPTQWRADLLSLICETPNLDWLLLTKRPENWSRLIEAAYMEVACGSMAADCMMEAWHEGEPPNNVWIGVSAGADQKAALEIPARIHFLSCEPMLHALDTTHAADFDWIIFGGESGKNARPCHVEWIRQGVAFCRANGIAPFVKQLGKLPYVERAERTSETETEIMDAFQRLEEARDEGDAEGVMFAEDAVRQLCTIPLELCDSHGGDMAEWPEDLRIREFPNTSHVTGHTSLS